VKNKGVLLCEGRDVREAAVEQAIENGGAALRKSRVSGGKGGVDYGTERRRWKESQGKSF